MYDNRICSHYTAFPEIDYRGVVRSWFKKENVDLLQMKHLSFDEIETDILQIQKELNKPFIIVSHYVTNNEGSRYELLGYLQQICKKHNILFIDPIKEIKNKDINFTIDKYFVKYDNLNHLTDEGNAIMSLIFKEYITRNLSL
jgi:hypothetical protein